MIEKRMNVFDNVLERNLQRLYTCKDVCQEATHNLNRETIHHTTRAKVVASEPQSMAARKLATLGTLTRVPDSST